MTIVFSPGITTAQNLQELLSAPGDFLGGGRNQGPKATVTAKLQPAPGVSSSQLSEGDEVVLSVHVKMGSDAYTYSQNPSFGGATRIAISETFGLDPVNEKFTADREPKVVFEEGFGQDVEKFPGDVTWFRRFRLTGAVSADQISIAGQIKFQVCDAQSCTPLTEAFEVFLDVDAASLPLTTGPADPENIETGNLPAAPPLRDAYVIRPTRPAPDPLTLQFELLPANAQAGETVTLAITMNLEDDWHTFGLIKHERQISNPTELIVTNSDNLRVLKDFTPVNPPEVVEQAFDDIAENVHHGTVTWTRIFEVTEAGPYGVAGELAYQICNTSCMPLKDVAFSLGSLQRPVDVANASPVSELFTPLSTIAGHAGAVDDILDFELQSTGEASLPWYLTMAFLGGLILNVMPCVLPVLAIKVMSFVQQAGESRGRVLLLNVCYSLGVIGVFLLLATLAVTLKLGWGGLFTKPEFILVMTAVVFAMGLSLLGVFEIPIPGMVGSAGGQHREGLAGAFMTGIFATLLATPCTGPFMGSTLAWSVKQSAGVVYLVWGVMGLGMASPYLMVGLFPKAVHFLPRPGMWMVRFKEFAGFTLMAATVWLLSTMSDALVIPTLVILLGIAIAAWMVGTLYDHVASVQRKTIVRLAALTAFAAFTWYGYGQYQEGRLIAKTAAQSAGQPTPVVHKEGELPWQVFSEERLRELVESSTPVLIDFTAEWCQICKFNERTALNTEATAAFVEEHGVVPLIADWTEEDPIISKWLDRFGRIGVPLYVIVPPGKPGESIVLDGQLTQGRILEALKQAVAPDVAAQVQRSSIK
ncbi:MAG: thioredoxin family protein [Planctomycetaceae bacterium]|nr:thioredoxin family protein [Planctomycetaceae bacterium]